MKLLNWEKKITIKKSNISKTEWRQSFFEDDKSVCARALIFSTGTLLENNLELKKSHLEICNNN